MLDFSIHQSCPFCDKVGKETYIDKRRHVCPEYDFKAYYQPKTDVLWVIRTGDLIVRYQNHKIYTVGERARFEEKLVFSCPNGQYEIILYEKEGHLLTEAEFFFYKDKADKLSLLC